MPAPLQAGTFLIASLGLEDPSFSRTVVLILQHRPDQTLGVIVNRPLGERVRMYPAEELRTLANGLESGGKPEGMFYQGGPEEPNSLIFLHRLQSAGEDATRICDGIYAGGDLDILRARMTDLESDSPLLRFYLGYADWAPGKLENEIALGAWILSDANIDLVFSERAGKRLAAGFARLGGQVRPDVVHPRRPVPELNLRNSSGSTPDPLPATKGGPTWTRARPGPGRGWETRSGLRAGPRGETAAQQISPRLE